MNIGMRVISVISTVILARILDPSDFGLVALALVLISTSNLFSGLGMRQALIQTDLDRSTAAASALGVTIVAGSVFTILVFFNAGFLGELLGNPETGKLLRWMAIIVLFQSVALVPEALLQKLMMFGRTSSGMIIPELVYVGVSITLALNNHGVWSLVYASICRSVVRVFILVMLCPGWEWANPLGGNLQSAKTLLRFGIQSTGSGFISFLNSVMDNLVVGKLLGVQALGYYSKSYDFSTNTIDTFNRVIGTVLFPSYAIIQKDRERLTNAYVRSLRLVSYVTVPISLGMLAVAPDIVVILLGEKWAPMIPSFQILSGMCLVRSISSTTSPLFLATGNPGFDLKAGLVVTILAVIGMFGFLSYGISGVALAFLLAHIAGLGFNMFQVRSLFEGAARRMIATITPVIGAGLIMVLSVIVTRNFADKGALSPVLFLVLLISAGAVTYILALWILQRNHFKETISVLRSSLSRKNTIADSLHR